MNHNKNKLWISNYLKWHPLLIESEDNRRNYIKTLIYCCKLWSEEDLFTEKLIHLFESAIINKPTNSDFELKSPEHDLDTDTEYPYPYYYVLVIDCLFILTFDNPKKAKRIIDYFELCLPADVHEKLNTLYQGLYFEHEIIQGFENTATLQECWHRNKHFLNSEPVRFLVTANMSAGKSTLLNALVGKKVNRVSNTACTAKIHYIQNQPYEDGFNYEYDHLLDLNATESVLLEDFSNDDSDEIIVGTYFRNFNTTPHRICFIDTPGVNSSQNTNHKEITEQTISKGEYDKIIYVLNGSQFGTEDDRRHLEFVAKEAADKEIYFVVNKLDNFNKSEDNIQQTLLHVREELLEIGFHHSIICPISAYAGYLAKEVLWESELDEEEWDEFNRLSRKLKKASFRLSDYYPSYTYQEEIPLHFENTERSEKAYHLLKHSGLLSLENCLLNSSTSEYEAISSEMQIEQDTENSRYDDKNELIVNVVATTSAGKSTLINALLREKLIPSSNEACTATITEIHDTDAECFSAETFNQVEQEIENTSELTLKKMKTYNDNPEVATIKAYGNIPFVTAEDTALVLMDTPGPNNSRNKDHQLVTEKALSENAKNLVLYVLDGSSLSSTDDDRLLNKVAESMQIGGKQSRDRFIFVINKLDDFIKDEDNIQETLKGIKERLEEKGIRNPNIYPLSALTALNTRTLLKDIDMINYDDDDEDIIDARADIKKFTRKMNTAFHFEQYAPLPRSIKDNIDARVKELESLRGKNNPDSHSRSEALKELALIHSGIISLEHAITSYSPKMQEEPS